MKSFYLAYSEMIEAQKTDLKETVDDLRGQGEDRKVLDLWGGVLRGAADLARHIMDGETCGYLEEGEAEDLLAEVYSDLMEMDKYIGE